MTRGKLLVPNFIVLLVSPPGIGKSVAIEEVSNLWHDVTPKLNIAPHAISRGAFIDQLASIDLQRMARDAQGKPVGTIWFYHSILVAAPEFGVLVPTHDLDFLNNINQIYDCGRDYVERKRSLKDIVNITRPHTSILAGTQPSYLGQLLPDTAYGMGFTARCIMVYQGSSPRVPLFGSVAERNATLRKNLVGQLCHGAQLFGQVSWDSAVQEALQQWVDSGMNPVPEHFRLLHYTTRRDLHVLKLCIVRATSQLRMNVTVEDFLWAKDTLLEAEDYMTDVFKDMMAGPDTQIIADLVAFARTTIVKEKRDISQSRLIHFLSTRVPTFRVKDLLGAVVGGGFLVENATQNGVKTYGLPKVGDGI